MYQPSDPASLSVMAVHRLSGIMHDDRFRHLTSEVKLRKQTEFRELMPGIVEFGGMRQTVEWKDCLSLFSFVALEWLVERNCQKEIPRLQQRTTSFARFSLVSQSVEHFNHPQGPPENSRCGTAYIFGGKHTGFSARVLSRQIFTFRSSELTVNSPDLRKCRHQPLSSGTSCYR